MIKLKGSTINQYAIIITIVALALIPVFIILGKTLSDTFNYYKETLSGKQATSANAKPSTTSSSPLNKASGNPAVVSNPLPAVTNTQPTSIPSTPPPAFDSPVNVKQQCKNGVCTLDFGDFVLNGIPQDFGSYIQTGGTSGGFDKIAASLQQIADSLTDPAEEPLKNQLHELIKQIGTQNAASTQIAMNINMYECVTGGGCDQMLPNALDPSNLYHSRDNSISIHNPPLPGEVYRYTNNLDPYSDRYVNDEFDQFVFIAQNVSTNSTGKDYSSYIAAINALKDYSLDIKHDFFEEVMDTNIEPPQLKDPAQVDIEDIKRNVASKTEDLNAYMICKISKTHCK
jgi:Flp pilus assembly pilin Flp